MITLTLQSRIVPQMESFGQFKHMNDCQSPQWAGR